jgi:phenylacetate-coenzyme A ligase PaaK-like adenylate-forming protein
MTQSSGSRPLGWSNRVRVFDVRSPAAEVVAGLNGYQPAVVVAYARALRDLAEEKLAGRLAIAPHTLISGGEPLVPADRQLIESAFGVRVTNLYAASEHMVIAIGRPEIQGMVLQEDDLIFELYDDHTLITNLLNRTLPLVRYRMNDVLLPLQGPQARWNGYQVVQDVVGRQELAPRFLNEAGEWDTIHPIVFVEFFVPGLQGFQLVVHDGGSFTFLAVIGRDLSEAQVVADLRSRLDDLLATKKMRNVVYRVKIVDGLSADPRTGKFQLVRMERKS